MSGVPSTIIIKVLDKARFPMDMAMVVFREMFSFGVKDISVKGDRIFICLQYTPKYVSLNKKFGNLPIQYLRTKMVDKDKDLYIFEKAMKRFNFALRVEEEEEEDNTKKKIKLTPKTHVLESFDLTEDDDDKEPGPSMKRIRTSTPPPPPPPPPPQKKTSRRRMIMIF